MNALKLCQAFVEGLALIVSPCILPVLPLVLGSSVEGGNQRPYGVITGFVIAFSVFALVSRQVVMVLGIDIEWIQRIAYILLFLFGLVLLSTRFSEWFSGVTQRFADMGSRLSFTGTSDNGFLGGLMLGFCIGLVWTPCAGPILASVIVQIILEKSNFESIMVIVSFALGAGIPMLYIARWGQKMIKTLHFFRQHSLAVRRTMGVMILLTVVVSMQQGVLFSGGRGNAGDGASASGKILNPVAAPYTAPEIKGIEAWINTRPLTIQNLRGKVVLVDFWTYSCVNCLRTLPYLKDWHQKYHDKGLVIIGIHAPEFEFEKKLSNVQTAVQRNGILYPVGLDNKLVTWQNFSNSYWPAHYLINQQGQVVYTHFGEGDYDVTEQNIRTLLGVTARPTSSNVTVKQGEAGIGQTPETYLGYDRAERFASNQPLRTGTFTFPDFLSVHSWALKGPWKIDREKIISSQAGSTLRLNFYARKVFLVLGTAGDKPVKARLFLNGKPLLKANGEDVINAELTIKNHTLYELISLPKTQNAQLDIQAETPGLEAYAFTFSS